MRRTHLLSLSLLSSLLGEYHFRIYQNGTVSIPGDSEILHLPPCIGVAVPRSLYLPVGNVHSRYIVAAMARSVAPAKNTKCEMCSAICLPLCGE